ncbi:MAG: CRTAC1 family protein [Deferribacteres bacterium]|nr:CRTAC1 family protein [Deferribacteres bacterium]
MNGCCLTAFANRIAHGSLFANRHFSPLLMATLLIVGCQQQGEQNVENDSQQTSYLTDISEQVKLDFVHNPGVDGSYFMPESIGSGAAFLDYDNDGDLDIYLINCAWHSEQAATTPPLRNQLFQQQTDGTFINVTAESGLGDTGYGMGVAVGDIDNDGFVDVYISNYGPDALYRNNGDGTFSNISKRAGISNPAWSCSVIFIDENRDGYLDIFITNYIVYDPAIDCTDRAGRIDYCGPGNSPGAPDVLYRNLGNGTFADISLSSGIGKVESVSLGAASADFNNDGYADIYVANDGQENQLWINQKNGTFTDVATAMGAAVNNVGRREAGMGIAIGDVDGDLDDDIFLTHLRTETNTLYRNESDALFVDASTPSGLAGPSLPMTGFGTGFFDFDLDGDLDLAIVNGRVTRGTRMIEHDPPQLWDDYAEPNQIFENDGSGRFREVSSLSPAYSSQVVENSRGLAFGDVDNDGDLDLLVANEGGRARLYRNDWPQQGNYLVIKAWLPDLRRDAIGAVITVELADKKIKNAVRAGYSFVSSHDNRVHFGLGSATEVQRITVRWPDGNTETFAGVAANQFIILEKGASGK